MEIAII